MTETMCENVPIIWMHLHWLLLRQIFFGKAYTGNIEALFPSIFASAFPFTIVYKGGKWGIGQLSKASWDENVFGKNQKEIGIYQNSLQLFNIRANQ